MGALQHISLPTSSTEDDRLLIDSHPTYFTLTNSIKNINKNKSNNLLLH